MRPLCEPFKAAPAFRCAALLCCPRLDASHVASLHYASSLSRHVQFDIEVLFGLDGLPVTHMSCTALPVLGDDLLNMLDRTPEILLAIMYVIQLFHFLRLLCRKRKQRPGVPLVRGLPNGHSVPGVELNRDGEPRACV
jgi:hypothetical protein